MKKGFTLVEVIAVMAILLIGSTLIFSVFSRSYVMFNRSNELSTMEDSFRNSILDIENELNDSSVKSYKYEAFENYKINNYEVVEPIILIDKGENSLFYFKGKKSNSEISTVEKVVFDNTNINNGEIVVKELKTIVNKIDGDIEIKSIGKNLLEVNFTFSIGDGNNSRNYTAAINLNKSTEVKVDLNDEVTEPEIPNIPIPPAEVPEIAKLFAQYTFIVLDTNSFNKRENLINIKPMFQNEKKDINVSLASYYIQAISTDVMKKYIDANIGDKKNTFVEGNKIMRAPALKEEYKPNGLNINGYEEFKNIVKVDNGQGKIVKNNNVDVGYMYRDSNQAILLVNGDLNITSNDSKLYLAISENGGGQKLTIYCTGKINIDMNNKSGTVYLNNCTLISANQININSNNTKIERDQAGEVGKLSEVLNKNLKLQ